MTLEDFGLLVAAIAVGVAIGNWVSGAGGARKREAEPQPVANPTSEQKTTAPTPANHRPTTTEAEAPKTPEAPEPEAEEAEPEPEEPPEPEPAPRRREPSYRSRVGGRILDGLALIFSLLLSLQIIGLAAYAVRRGQGAPEIHVLVIVIGVIAFFPLAAMIFRLLRR